MAKPRTQEELDEQDRINRYAEAMIRRDKALPYPAKRTYELDYSTDGRVIDWDHLDYYKPDKGMP